MRHITVAYATMSDYYYICVSMLSILHTAHPDTFVDFVILHGSDFTSDNKLGVLEIIGKYPRQSLRFLDVSHYNFAESKVWFIAKATYFRLVLPEVLEEERCLYLDGDTLVCEDLSELFETDMEGCCLAGVKAVHYHRDEVDPDYCRKACLPDKRQYINAGVLLMDLAAMRERGLIKEFMRRMAMELPSQDQDVLNGACYDSIKFLPLRYNTMVKYAYLPLSGYHGCFKYEEIIAAWNRPTIIHYTDPRKPWTYPNMVFGDLWWQSCRRDEGLFRYFCRISMSVLLYQASCAHAIQPRLLDLTYAGAVMIWGAGQMANEVIGRLAEQEVHPICCLVSDGYGKHNDAEVNGIPVIEFGELSEDVNDVTLIIAVKEEYRQEVYLKAITKSFKRIICQPELIG